MTPTMGPSKLFHLFHLLSSRCQIFYLYVLHDRNNVLRYGKGGRHRRRRRQLGIYIHIIIQKRIVKDDDDDEKEKVVVGRQEGKRPRFSWRSRFGETDFLGVAPGCWEVAWVKWQPKKSITLKGRTWPISIFFWSHHHADMLLVWGTLCRIYVYICRRRLMP
jgi:hypothetical protein